MTKSKKIKTMPAGKSDEINITYTEFAANQERTGIKVGEGKEFDNDELLKMLGFEQDEQGILTLQAEEHHIDRDNNGEKVRIKDNKIIKLRDVASLEEKQEESEIGA